MDFLSASRVVYGLGTHQNCMTRLSLKNMRLIDELVSGAARDQSPLWHNQILHNLLNETAKASIVGLFVGTQIT